MKPGELKVTIVAAGFSGSQPGSLFGTHFEGQTGRRHDVRSASTGAEGAGQRQWCGAHQQAVHAHAGEPGTSSKNPVIHARGEESAEDGAAEDEAERAGRRAGARRGEQADGGAGAARAARGRPSPPATANGVGSPR